MAEEPPLDMAEEPQPIGFAGWFASPNGRTTTSAAFSALVHGVLLLLLGLISGATGVGPKIGLSLTASSGDLDQGGMMDSAPLVAVMKSNLRAETLPPMTFVPTGMTSMRPSKSDSDTLVHGSGGTGTSDQLSGKGTASFFGAVGEGKKFVYVIDNSNSMKNGKFERACAELAASISKLTARQSYYVLFFSDHEYPLHYPDDVPVMLPAITMNTTLTQKWIKQQTLHRGTRAHRAFEKALSLKPDAIYVLTDGRFTDDTDRFLASLKNNVIPIHAIGFGRGEATGGEGLKTIASMHGGTYTFVNVTR